MAEVTADIPVFADGPPRQCLSCGYDLRGLGDEPRCPECGFRAIPEDMRRHVWEFVDQRRLSFSNPLTPWARRPPGWWWALDRDGDVRRSGWAATAYVSTAVLMLGMAIAAADVVVSVEWYAYPSSNAPDAPIEIVGFGQGIGGRLVARKSMTIERSQWNQAVKRGTLISKGIGLVQPRAVTWYTILCVLIWLILVWVMPVWIGLVTQIRTGMPSFAEAPRTIVAAGNYEAHQLVYVAGFGVILMAAELILRLQLYPSNGLLYEYIVRMFPVILFVYGTLGWLGPLRSDYTRQLIQSRIHYWRIMLMYVIGLPIGFAIAIASLRTDAF